MFKSLRTKLVSVKGNVTTSIKNVGNEIGTRFVAVSNAGEKKEQAAPPTDVSSTPLEETQSIDSKTSCNDAAQDLLYRYEVSWEELYKSSQNNILKAKTVNKELHLVQSAVATCENKLQEFETEVKQLPTMLSSIQRITDQIVDLHSHCSLIEDGLAVLENLCDSADMDKAKLKEEQKLSTYEAQKGKLLAEYSEQLAAEHRKKMIAVEMREAELRREKELFYQKAFEEDLRRFKAEQKLVNSQTSLEEMTIEPDTHEAQQLEAFLNDGDTQPPNPKTTYSNGIDNQTPTDIQLDTEAAAATADGAVDDTDSTDVNPGEDKLSPRHRSESESSLEWDYRDDDLKIIAAEQLESSLEQEINGIIGESKDLPLTISPTADSELPEKLA